MWTQIQNELTNCIKLKYNANKLVLTNTFDLIQDQKTIDNLWY